MIRFLLPAFILLTACSTPPAPRPAHEARIDQLASSARSAFERGETDRADRLYTESLQAARAADDSARIGRLAYNLAACRIAARQTNGVDGLLAEARADLVRSGAPSLELDLLQVRYQLLTGDIAGARATVQRLSTAAHDASIRTALRLLSALVEAEAGDAVALEQQLRALKDPADPLVAHLRGVHARLSGVPIDAARFFDRSAEAYREQGRLVEMAAAWTRAGDAWAAAGRPAEAAERFYRAARSAHARQQSVDALRLMQRALELLPKDVDGATVTRFQNLSTAITDSGRSHPDP